MPMGPRRATLRSTWQRGGATSSLQGPFTRHAGLDVRGPFWGDDGLDVPQPVGQSGDEHVRGNVVIRRHRTLSNRATERPYMKATGQDP